MVVGAVVGIVIFGCCWAGACAWVLALGSGVGVGSGSAVGSGVGVGSSVGVGVAAGKGESFGFGLTNPAAKGLAVGVGVWVVATTLGVLPPLDFAAGAHMFKPVSKATTITAAITKV